jgi:hypothetical protein
MDCGKTQMDYGKDHVCSMVGLRLTVARPKWKLDV